MARKKRSRRRDRTRAAQRMEKSTEGFESLATGIVIDYHSLTFRRLHREMYLRR